MRDESLVQVGFEVHALMKLLGIPLRNDSSRNSRDWDLEKVFLPIIAHRG